MKESKKKSGWILAAVMGVALLLTLAACQPQASAQTTPTAAPTETASAPVDPTAAPTAEPVVLEGATTTDSGLQYLEIEAGEGESPKEGDLITMNFAASLPDGTELASTYTDNQPAVTLWGAERLLPGWEEGVGLMKPGGKAKLVLPPELAFGVEGMGGIPPNSQIIIEVELLKVEAAPVPTEVAENELVKTDSGLQYYNLAEGSGDEAVQNGSVSTLYTIWAKTDSGYDYIDQSREGQPVSFVIGRGDVVFPGWEEGVTGMKVGGKRLLVIPPDLGMGEAGNGLVPPGATLVMEIELTEASEPRVPAKVDEKDYVTTESGLKYYDLTPGTGETPEAGQTVVVHYTGWLEDGTQFDSSVDSGQPFSFQLGGGNVIPGWDEGVATMKVGGKRQLVIPAELGYGETGAGNVIPPGATLIFEVELLDVNTVE